MPRKVEASMDGQRLSNVDTGSSGQFWPAGKIKVTRGGTTTFTAHSVAPSFLQKVTGYSRETKLGRIVALRTDPRLKVPMSDICGRWVDYFRRNKPGQKSSLKPANAKKSETSARSGTKTDPESKNSGPEGSG